MERLTTLAAQGGSDVPAVLAGLRTRQDRQRALKAEAQALAGPGRSRRSDRALEAEMRGRLLDWRSLLRRNVTEARPVLTALLAGRLPCGHSR